jgi:hypothetical protein
VQGGIPRVCFLGSSLPRLTSTARLHCNALHWLGLVTSLVDLRARTHTYMQHASTCHARTHACRDAVTPLERFPIPGNLGVDLICSMRSCYMCEEAWRGAAAWIGWDRGFCAFSCSCCVVSSIVGPLLLLLFRPFFFLAFVRSSSHLHTYIRTQRCSSRCPSLVVHASSRQLFSLSATNHTADRGKKRHTSTESSLADWSSAPDTARQHHRPRHMIINMSAVEG